MEFTWMQLVTLAIAMVGAVLGVMNTWRTFANDRVRVRVKPTTIFVPQRGWCLGIEVVNLSTFAITVSTVGVTMRGTSRHLQIFAPALSSGDTLPKRLEPRTGFTAFAGFGTTEEEPGFRIADEVYVSTACGEWITGGRKQLAIALANLAATPRQ